MADNASCLKIVTLRATLSKLAEHVEEYARLYEDSRDMPREGPARKELAQRLTTNMACLSG
jgi:hypothetical protein